MYKSESDLGRCILFSDGDPFISRKRNLIHISLSPPEIWIRFLEINGSYHWFYQYIFTNSTLSYYRKSISIHHTYRLIKIQSLLCFGVLVCRRLFWSAIHNTTINTCWNWNPCGVNVAVAPLGTSGLSWYHVDNLSLHADPFCL